MEKAKRNFAPDAGADFNPRDASGNTVLSCIRPTEGWRHPLRRAQVFRFFRDEEFRRVLSRRTFFE
ncbi:MAG: hypothetical protein LBT65_10565 [Synergistaceae bacterium]|nr:hypothetical protein [Synergistaceae bacterium]